MLNVTMVTSAMGQNPVLKECARVVKNPVTQSTDCSESLNACVDIKKIEASTAYLPRRDERQLRAPVLLPKFCYWLRVKIKAENNVNLENSIFSVEGTTQGYTGVTIDNARFRKIRGAFLRETWQTYSGYRLVSIKTQHRTWKITITTDRTDAADPL